MVLRRRGVRFCPATETVILPLGVPRSVNLSENLFNNDYCRRFINHPVGGDADLRELASIEVGKRFYIVVG